MKHIRASFRALLRNLTSLSILLSFTRTKMFCIKKIFIFPSEYSESLGRMSHEMCEPSPNFLPQEYDLPETVQTIRKVLVSSEMLENRYKDESNVCEECKNF